MSDRRMPSGLMFREAARHAQAWWDLRGRFLIRNPEFQDPDLGVPSGILRGLPFMQLTRKEILRVAPAGRRRSRRRAGPAQLRSSAHCRLAVPLSRAAALSARR
jgi:hypothetical protein